MITDVSNGIAARPAYRDTTFFVGWKFEGIEGAYPVWLDFMFLDRTTCNPKRAWVGTAEQAKAVRRKFPWTKSLKLVRNAPVNNVRKD